MMYLSAAAFLASLISLGSAIPTPQSGIPTTGVLTPIVRSQYEVWTGAIEYNTGTGEVFKNGITSDITTLLTFNFPASLAGMTCEFHFYLDPTATVSGTGEFDLFTSQAPPTQDTTSWPSGNLRDQYAGRMQTYAPGEAAWVQDIAAAGKVCQCPDTAMLYAVELVGVGDVDEVAWNPAAGSGAYVKYY
jgi:hypothetical protein